MSRRPNIAAVAQEAGVSRSTVSRALNGGYVKSELKTHIDAVIKRIGYRPWLTARNFAMGRSGSLGIVLASAPDAAFINILSGVESELRAPCTSLQIGGVDRAGAYDSRIVATWVKDRRIDGLILVHARESERSLVMAARRANLPVALIAPEREFESGQIFRSRNRQAGRDVGDHLLDLGHRRLAFVGGPKRSAETRERLAGLKDSLSKSGVRLRPDQVVYAKSSSASAGAAFASRWLSQGRSARPTAVVFANDSLALGFMRTAQSRGIKVPDEVSVVGFDDTPEAALHWPGLTTSKHYMRALGASACKAILRQVVDGRPKPVATQEFPMKLVVRESSGVVPKTRR